MAPSVVPNGTRLGVANGMQQPNGEAPASTLAAQLVNNLTRGTQQSKHQDREDFEQLLRIFESDSQEERHPDDAESREEHVKLIDVVVKAGLDVLSDENPFENRDLLVKQALRSIAVIEATVRRNAALLHAPIGESQPDQDPRGPLYLWLIPRILRVILHGSSDRTHEAVSRSLALILSLEKKIRLKLPRISPIRQYVKNCIYDCTYVAEVFEHDSEGRCRQTMIPSLQSVTEAYPGRPLSVANPASFQIVTRSNDEALALAICLASALQPADTRPKAAKARAVSEQAWILTCLEQIWAVLSPLLIRHPQSNLARSCLISYLDLLGRYISALVGDMGALSMSKAVALLDRIMQTLCASSKPLQSRLKFVPHQHLGTVLHEVAIQCRKSHDFSRIVWAGLLPALVKIEKDTISFKVEGDSWASLRVAVESSIRWHERVLQVKDRDMEAQKPVARLADHTEQQKILSVDARPPKRARTSDSRPNHTNHDTFEVLAEELCTLLSPQGQRSLPDLHLVAAEAYPQLTENEQRRVFLLIGRVACIDKVAKYSGDDSNIIVVYDSTCSVCNGERSPGAEKSRLAPFLDVFRNLLQLPQMHKRKQSNVIAMIALRRLLSHTTEPTSCDLSESIFGQWCFKALQNPARDIRIAAGRLLPVFLRPSTSSTNVQENCRRVLEFLRSLSASGVPLYQETTILAWGEMARVTDGDERNIVLLRLVEYLGNTNQVICGLAYEELRRIANDLSLSLLRLFAPYWRTVAPAVVNELLKRPQVVQQMADLLAITIPDLLVLTQTYTIPYLVLTKRRDILQRIADASGRSSKQLCMEHSNLAATLACILMQTTDDTESIIMTLFTNVSTEFGKIHYTDLLKAEQPLTAAELLKAVKGDDDSSREKVQQALRLLASVTHGRQSSSRGTARKIDAIGPFFEDHVLGIMANFSDTINDGRDSQPISEKLRCLGAIKEMLSLAQNHVSNGLPQISACLQSAIEVPELCNAAFTSWSVMVGTLGEDEVGPLVDLTFAIIAHYWTSFNEDVQAKAHDMVAALFKSFPDLIRDIASTIPSLAGIPLMKKFEEEVGRIKAQMDVKPHFEAFSQRCGNENSVVVVRALTELEQYLREHQSFLHGAAVQEQPDFVVSHLVRSVLDTCTNFKELGSPVPVLAAKCLGHIGCLDPTRIEATVEQREMLVLSNFMKAEETKEFIVFFLREILVKVFLSTTNPRAQGFLAYAMQELLMSAEFDKSVILRSRESHYNANYYRWMELPESVRNTLTPFLTSKYCITPAVQQPSCTFPLYKPSMNHGQWLRGLTYDLLRKAAGENAQVLFPVLSRIVRFQDISIPTFLVPFAVLNVIVGGTVQQVSDIEIELQHVLTYPLPENDTRVRDNLILCSQNVFQILDYLSRWMQEKKKEINAKSATARGPRSTLEADIEFAVAQIESVDKVLNLTIPAEVISRRAVECKSYARALFHWEEYIRQQKELAQDAKQRLDLEPLYERLQDIYTQIDEPDGIEGISANLHVLNIDQQVLEHRKAGRWTAVQNWYELQLAENAGDLGLQYNLLTSLKESGQYDVLLNHYDSFRDSQASSTMALPFVAEAAWMTARWDRLKLCADNFTESPSEEFNVGLGTALLALFEGDRDRFIGTIQSVRQDTAKSLTKSNTLSLQTCHDAMLKFHAITEIELLSGMTGDALLDKIALMSSLDQRLNVIGAFGSNKQYLLGIRKAVMQLSQRRDITYLDISAVWLTSAKLARKANLNHQAFNAVLQASHLGDQSATLEHSRLLWREGQHRKAIRSLEGAIAANVFRSHDHVQPEESMEPTTTNKASQQNLLTAKAHLLLAKWNDHAGQTQSDLIIRQYRAAVSCFSKWEKGHYYLGKHYNKLLESEKAKPPPKQAQTFITGETAKLVIENYLRSMSFGAKYLHQTLPRILTLWLELGSEAEQPLDPVYGNDDNFRNHTSAQRRKMLTAIHTQLKKYIDRLPAFLFYTALSQIVARICHTHKTVFSHLVDIVAKVVSQHPQQALWTLLAIVKSSDRNRASRGVTCMSKLTEYAKRTKGDGTGLQTLINTSQQLSDQLLRVCEGELKGKSTNVSITKDLGFNHKAFAGCRLVIPLEITLTANLPPVTEAKIRQHKAFSKDVITISSVLDDVMVLNSLQRPRRISIRGSDGHVYALLCKPKDDLRKDQRLMEFNAMINRSLKKDADSSKRRLYIKTYAVTPLNEECGLIEWIDNLKTLREILLNAYKQKNIPINYNELRNLLNEASSTPSKTPVFTNKILTKYPPAFHEWFVDIFPEPSAWFAARLRYTRSCAVMSIVGHVLGLGDRHGENILFEETTGGTFHVDFNCLFDKGLTFEKPELVPFRLTHNMVDAFGAYGIDGPFRKSAELTLMILRQHEDTLMTILETFVYDPTTDFIGKKKKSGGIVPDTPEGVLENVRNKVRGLMPGESVPLGVEGYVQELITQATDPWRLCSMYIGWCAFF